MKMYQKALLGALLSFSLVLLSACGGSGAAKTAQQISIESIAMYAKNGVQAPTLQDYINVGVLGVNASNIDLINTTVQRLTYADVDSAEEIREIAENLGITLLDLIPPVISLIGSNTVSIAQGSVYIEEGAIATDLIDGEVPVNITGSVDTNTVGIYTITYFAEDKAKNSASITRRVNVLATPDCPQVITHAYNPATGEENDFATPCDVPDGWVIGSLIDNTPPVIRLLGVSPLHLTIGSVYNDAGASATDNKDGDISANLIIDNPVNTSVAGTYYVTFNVVDAAGNQAIQVTRTVIVSLPAKVYGNGGSYTVAAPMDEPVNGKSVILMPVGVSAAKPTPVVFFAPGWKSTNYTDYESLLNFIVSHGYSVIATKDDSGNYTANHLISYIREMVNNPAIKPLLDLSRIGVIGHSSGGGHAFSILNELSDTEGWGSSGRFLFAMEPWFAFDMRQSDMQTLPSNTNTVILQFGEGGFNVNNNTDTRIPLSEFYLLESIPDNRKDYQIFTNANHDYPKGNTPYSEMQGVLKPLDALMELTFKDPVNAVAHQIALEVGNDDPYNQGLGAQKVKLIGDYHYKCHGADNSGADSTLVNSDIDYCAIHEGAFPPETFFSATPTNTSKAKPALGRSIVDQAFGKTIIRFTDRLNQNDTPTVNANGDRVLRGNSHPYPKTQAWNSDMSMLRLRYRLYDAKTLTELPITSGLNDLSDLYYKNGALSEMKWSNVNPNVFYGVWSNQFWKGTINRATNTISFDLLKDFATAQVTYDRFTIGKYEGNIDFNDQYVIFAARKTGVKYLTAIVYDMQNNTILGSPKDFPAAEWPDQGQVFDWISVSPLGNHILMSTGNKIDQYDMNLNFVRPLASSAGHGDLGIDQNGDEAYIQYEYGLNSGIWIYRLKDGFRIQLLPDKYNGGHISCRNYNRRGWCYASTTQEGFREVSAIRLDYSGPVSHIVNRFSQTHTSGHNSMGNVSPDGKQLLFESDWGDGAIHWADRETYLVK